VKVVVEMSGEIKIRTYLAQRLKAALEGRLGIDIEELEKMPIRYVPSKCKGESLDKQGTPYEIDRETRERLPLECLFPQPVEGTDLYYTWGYDPDRDVIIIFKKDIPTLDEARRWVRENKHRYLNYEMGTGMHGEPPLCILYTPEIVRGMRNPMRVMWTDDKIIATDRQGTFMLEVDKQWLKKLIREI